MSILKQIRNGEFDEDLDDMALAITARKRTVGLQQFAQIKIGSKVRFISTIRPTYLRGMEATVVGKKVSKLVVRMPQRIGRFGGDIRVPPSLVEFIAPPTPVDAYKVVSDTGGADDR